MVSLKILSQLGGEIRQRSLITPRTTRARIARNSTGYKPVPGGTGNGKTSAIPNAVRGRNKRAPSTLYVANRIQLLDEMAANLRGAGVRFLYHLRRDVDLVVEMLKNAAHRENFEHFLRTPTVVTGLNASPPVHQRSAWSPRYSTSHRAY